MRASLVAMCLIALVSPAFAKVVETFDVAGWEGGAVVDDKTGKLVMCSAGHDEAHGMRINLAVAHDFTEFLIDIENDNWNLEQGSFYPATVMIDKAYRYQGRAQALASTGAVIAIPGEGHGNLHVMDAAMSGNTMIVQADQIYRFELGKAAAAALDKIGSCVANYAASAEEPAAPTSTAQRRLRECDKCAR